MFRKSQDNDVYEYIYTRRTYRKTLLVCATIWLAILILRLVAFAIFGYPFAVSPYNLASLGISGILLGVCIQAVRTLKASSRIGTVDTNTGSLSIADEALDPDERREATP